MAPFTILHPDIDLSLLTSADQQEMMLKYRAIFARTECELNKLKRSQADAALIDEANANLEKIWKSMEILSQFSGFSIFFDPPRVATPPVPEPANGNSSGDEPPVSANGNSPGTSANQNGSAGSHDQQTKSKMLKRPSDNETGWETVKSKKKNGRKNSEPVQTQGNDREASSSHSKNSFEVLENISEIQNSAESAEMETSESTDAQTAPPKKKKVPPFYLIPPPHWATLLTSLKFVAPSRRSKTQGRYLKVTIDTEDEHRALQKFLQQENVAYKSYLLEDQKQVKLVLRGMPINTKTEAIRDELNMEGFEEIVVTQMYRGPVSRKYYFPLFHVSLPKQPDWERIYSITELMGTEVTFENWKGNGGPSQCFNCQGFFHTAAACRLPPRCVKCGGDHSSKSCGKSFDEPCHCCNCGGDHPANFRNCPKFPKTNKNRKNKSNSQAKNGKGKTQNNERNIVQKSSTRTFSSEKAVPARTFAGAATGHKVAPSPPSIPNSSVPADASSETDLLKYIMALEKNYEPVDVLAAFKQALPALEKASSGVQRQFILYESLLVLVSSRGR